MYRSLVLAALVPLALGDYSYSYESGTPTAAPTSSMAPTRTDTYAPTRMTEAPSYAPTTDTYAPTDAPTVTAAPVPDIGTFNLCPPNKNIHAGLHRRHADARHEFG